MPISMGNKDFSGSAGIILVENIAFAVYKTFRSLAAEEVRV